MPAQISPNVSPTIGAIDPEALAINRKKMLAQMLMAQAQPQQGQVVGGRYVPPSLLSTINSAVAPVVGAKAAINADNAEQQLGAKRQQLIADILTGKSQPSSENTAPYYLQAPGGQQAQGNSSNIDPRAAKLLQLGMQGYPGAMDAAKMVQEANKPTDSMREAAALGMTPGSQAYNAYVGTKYSQSGAWQVDPQTGGIKLAQGYAPGQGDVKTAEEAAKAKFDLIDVPTADGRTVKMTRDEYIRRSNPANPSPGNPGRANTPGLGVTQTPGEAKASQVMGEGVGKIYNDIQDAGFGASKRLNTVNRLESYLSDISTGKLQPAGYELAAYAKSAGLPVGENVGNAQAANAVARELALQLRNPQGGAGMPGAMSDADRNYLESMIAGVGKDPQANQKIIDGMRKIAQRDQEVAQLARDYKAKNGRFDEGFLSELKNFSEKNQLFDKNKPSFSGSSKTINGKNYVNINGKWYEQ